jgi:maltooligosyltrehalose trehalohydrolase
LYQGQRYDWQKNRRGKPSFGLPHCAFINYLENHDQTANSARGLRLHQMTSPGLHRALTAYMLLAPQPPMLFQGQEYSSSRPFFYFSDQKTELAELVRNGRKEFLAQFPRIKDPRIQDQLADPGALDTFERCKLDWTEKERHSSAYALHKDLIALRRSDPVLNGRVCEGVDGAVLSNDCLLLRYFTEDRLDRLLIVNLGQDLRVSPAPEPLLAPPDGRRWEPVFSTEDPKYSGFGETPLEGSFNWRIPAQAAVLMTSVPRRREGEEDDEDT